MEPDYKKMYFESLEQIKKMEERIKQLLIESTTDKLTNMKNRRTMDLIGKDNYSNYAVVLSDIDYFKHINDRYGHDVGDRILVEIGDILNRTMRTTDFVIRWGGDEILILLENCPVEETYEKLSIIKKAIQNEIYQLYRLRVTMSFGISRCNQNESLATAIKNADIALYTSKEKGKNIITIYNENDNFKYGKRRI